MFEKKTRIPLILIRKTSDLHKPLSTPLRKKVYNLLKHKNLKHQLEDCFS